MWVLFIAYLTVTGVNIASKEFYTLDECIAERDYIVNKYHEHIKLATCARKINGN